MPMLHYPCVLVDLVRGTELAAWQIRVLGKRPNNKPASGSCVSIEFAESIKICRTLYVALVY